MSSRAVIPVTATPTAVRLRARAAAALLGAALLAGCLAPSATGPAEDDASGPAARSKSGSLNTVLVCERVWDAAAGDSVWNCPDPKPPASP